MKPELISFKICPFVQRSIIVMNEKEQEFDITYIDLKNPPEWFSEISPLGKVPVLKVDGTVLFESAVIMEYLDEITPPSLHPGDPLHKALNRAWIEFASTLFMEQHQMLTAKDEAGFSQKVDGLKQKLSQLEKVVTGPFFNGETFSLIDAAYAPLFMRIGFLNNWSQTGLLDDLPKLTTWSKRLMEMDSVKNSTVAEIADLYRGFIKAGEGYAAIKFA
jgi:glutathione S-transferase